MNITFLNPVVEAYDEHDLQKKIERCFRMCYKSESHIKEGSESFLTGLIHNDHPNKHWSPLEHARITVSMPSMLADAFYIYNDFTNTAFFSINNTDDYRLDSNGDEDSMTEVTGNFRAWLEFLTTNLTIYQIGKERYDETKAYVKRKLVKSYPYIFKDDNDKEFDVKYPIEIREADDYQTFRIVTTRDILQEIARHRSLSFSVESTRYCNYGKKGMCFTLPRPYAWSDNVDNLTKTESPEDYIRSNFSRGLSVIRNDAGETIVSEKKIDDVFESIDAMNCMEDLYLASVAFSNAMYDRALTLGVKPQEARMLLPGGLKSEMMVTGTFKAWKHFIALRADAAAHPQIQILAEMIKESLNKNHPGWDK